MSNEHFILQGHSFANKTVTGNLARIPDFRALLNFDERADPDVVANLASVQIGEAINTLPLAQLYIRCDSLEELPGRFRGPPHAQTNSDLRTVRSLGAFVREVPLRASEISTAAPLRFKDADAASSISTSSRPLRPLVSGILSLRIQSRKCWHSTLSGSSCLRYGTYKSP